MAQDLDKLLQAVQNEESFIQFVAALASDFADERELEAANPSGPYSAGALGWENATVDGCFGAAAAYGESSRNRNESDAAQLNPWFRCAQILYGSKFYE